MSFSSKLTLGDIVDIEQITGESFLGISEGTISGKTLVALYYVIRRREDSTFTYADALAVPMDEVQSLMDSEDDPEANA